MLVLNEMSKRVGFVNDVRFGFVKIRKRTRHSEKAKGKFLMRNSIYTIASLMPQNNGVDFQQRTLRRYSHSSPTNAGGNGRGGMKGNGGLELRDLEKTSCESREKTAVKKGKKERWEWWE